MSNLHRSYTKILSVLQQLIQQTNFLNQIRKPKLSDIEVISLVLTAEYLNIDSERELFRRLPDTLYKSNRTFSFSPKEKEIILLY